jgi:hypothetical protein
MAGVAAIIAEADRLGRTLHPGEKADMFSGALLGLKPMAGKILRKCSPCGKPRKPCSGLITDDRQYRRESRRGASAWHTS